MASTYSGNRNELHAAIGRRFFSKPNDPHNEVKSGGNAFLALRAHGLVSGNESFVLTPLAERLLGTRSEGELHAIFATHLLLEHQGIQLVEVVESLQARGERVTASRVARDLTAIGVYPGGKSGENINPMRLWLAKAGVFTQDWTISESTLKGLIGATAGELAVLTALPLTQQALLRAMATVTDVPPLSGAMLRALAELQTPGLDIDAKRFAPSTLRSLEDGGWIDVTKSTSGRGAKSHQVVPTQKFRSMIAEPLMNVVIEQVHLQDPTALRRPIRDLLAVVNDKARSNHERGLALEGVCIQVARVAGARFLSWRLRSEDTEGAEVDVVAESVHAPYQIMQIQSKASAISGREVVDREVGVSAALKSNVILFVSSKSVGPAARSAANAHMRESSLSILFLAGSDLVDARLGAALSREWEQVRRVRSYRGRERAKALGA
ncbi:hypothetical protein G3T36_08190 [Diaminobutyricibacter tongyongensis]|uniref:Restriction endonuclease n=1 Tax=Leifsonia tongyongensis TaxID=1268043 RepID=A0A6L9XWN2_9MICO|nr:hypothetical protein [Diaminobutyricibacter tongyongensis]NEN05851.1 hypothetical protein [Diaminobutyricibacter tongyongensis]